MEKVYLFTPGDNEKKIQKALESAADAIIIDLEDAVMADKKDYARSIVYSILTQQKYIMPKVYVRINSLITPWFFEDLKMLQNLRHLDGVMIPKSEDKEPICHTAKMLKDDCEIIPLIESAEGVVNLEGILENNKLIKKVAFGSVDFSLDIGTEWTEEGIERSYAMSRIVLLSKVFGADPPIDAVFPVINDRESFIKDTQKGKQIGFYGKMVIHPKQIEWVNEIYNPSLKQIEWSQKVIQTYENSLNQGAVDLDGKLIDRPVYLLAKRILASSL